MTRSWSRRYVRGAWLATTTPSLAAACCPRRRRRFHRLRSRRMAAASCSASPTASTAAMAAADAGDAAPPGAHRLAYRVRSDRRQNLRGWPRGDAGTRTAALRRRRMARATSSHLGLWSDGPRRQPIFTPRALDRAWWEMTACRRASRRAVRRRAEAGVEGGDSECARPPTRLLMRGFFRPVSHSSH